jgi:hypothetical protein
VLATIVRPGLAERDPDRYLLLAGSIEHLMRDPFATEERAQRLAVRAASRRPLHSGLNSKIANDPSRALRDAGIVEQDVPRSWRVPDPLLRNFLLELASGG